MRFISAIVAATCLVSVHAGAAEVRRSAGSGATPLTTAVPEWRRPLTISAEEARLVGEAMSRDLPVHLTASEANRPAKLRLGYLNAVSVMPETFKLTVRVNDTVVGETSLQTSGKPEVLALNVPVGVLQPGFNSVRVSVRQTHRVDCSTKSTYELWTQLLQDQSELAFSGASGDIRDVRDLAAVQPDKDGATQIHVRLADERDRIGLARASRAVQSAVLLGHFANPHVQIDDEAGAGSRLDVIVGTTPELERLVGMRLPKAGPQSQVFHNIQDGRVTLLVSGETSDEVDAALDALTDLAASSVPQGSTAGLRALRNSSGRQVEGGETITLADLGVESEPFRGRLQRQTIRVQMPADLLVADYGRVTMALDAAYAPNLRPDSKLIVRVNGTPIANVPLSNTGGEVLSKRLVYLPVGSFKPGLNTIDLEAETRTVSDDRCEPAALTDQHERFLLSATSELSIPGLARIAALPSISSIVSGGLSRLSPSGELNVFVPKARHEAIEAALTLLSKMASVSGQTSRAAFTFDRVAENAPHVLTIGTYGDVPETIIQAAGLDPANLRGAGKTAPQLLHLSGEGQPVQVASIGDHVELPSGAADAKSDRASADRASDPDSLSRQLSGGGWRGSDIAKVLRTFNLSWIKETLQPALKGVGGPAIQTLNRLGLMHTPSSKGLVFGDEATLVVAQGAKSKDLELDRGLRLLPQVESTTVILAPTAELLASGVSDLLSGSLWQQLVGQAAVYTGHEGSVDTQVSGQIWLVPTAGLDLQNLRLIAAGWLSRNVAAYLVGVFALLLVLTLCMQHVLRVSGVREK